MADVSIVKCNDYNSITVRSALVEAIDAVGGFTFIRKGMTIGIKANLVSAAKPSTGTTTHPTIISELAKLLLESGASKVIVGDSPGGIYNSVFVNRVYTLTGMYEVEKSGVELNQNFEEIQGLFPEGHILKEFTYTAYLNKVDAIVNVCKLKSHGMMCLSAAAKNMFGVIPGTKKPEYHYRFPNHMDFASMIIDIDTYFKPQLSIVDAIIGMEGNGPTAGTPKYMGNIVVSKSPHMADLVCAYIIGLDVDEVPTLVKAIEYGLIPKSITELDIVGNINEFLVTDFQKIHHNNETELEDILSGPFGKIIGKIGKKVLSSVPNVQKNECIGCQKCYNICPAKAITMKGKIPYIDRKKCIKCFCCQEFCPKGAMKVKRPLIASILSK